MMRSLDSGMYPAAKSVHNKSLKRKNNEQYEEYQQYVSKNSDKDILLRYATDPELEECKSRSVSRSSSIESSLSPSPSPSPCTMLSDMIIEESNAPYKYKKYTQDIAQRVKTCE